MSSMDHGRESGITTLFAAAKCHDDTSKMYMYDHINIGYGSELQQTSPIQTRLQVSKRLYDRKKERHLGLLKYSLAMLRIP